MPSAWWPTDALSFLILTYFRTSAALIVCGLGLRIRLFPGEAPFGLTVVPAVFAVIALAIRLSIALVPTDLQRRLGGWARSGGRAAQIAQQLANLPASASAGMRDALEHVRTRDPGLAGAFLFWGFQILVLWAAFRVRRLAAHAPCSCRRSSWACSGTCCRCRGASAASRAG